jgi:hypothetical protein
MDPISADYVVEFRDISYGRVRAIIIDEAGMQIDILTGTDFTDAYNQVIDNYPQAKWLPPESTEEPNDDGE